MDLSAVSAQNVTVDYAITGTATGSGEDYTLGAGKLTINAGETSGTITIASIIDDPVDEPDETIIITLSNPVNATPVMTTLILLQLLIMTLLRSLILVLQLQTVMNL